jgi:hypothetical protein
MSSQDLFRSFVNGGSKLVPRPAALVEDGAAPAAGSREGQPRPAASSEPPAGKYHHPPWGTPNDVEWAPSPRESVCRRWYWKGACSGRCPFFHRGPQPLWVVRAAAADGRDRERAPSRPGRAGYLEGRAALEASGVTAQIAFSLAEGEAARARNPGVAARRKALGAIRAGVDALAGALSAKDAEIEAAMAELRAQGGGGGGGSGGGGGGGGGAPPSPAEGVAAEEEEEEEAAPPAPAADVGEDEISRRKRMTLEQADHEAAIARRGSFARLNPHAESKARDTAKALDKLARRAAQSGCPNAAAAAKSAAKTLMASVGGGAPAAGRDVTALRRQIAVLQGTRIELRRHLDAWTQTAGHALLCAGEVVADENAKGEGGGEGGGMQKAAPAAGGEDGEGAA